MVRCFRLPTLSRKWKNFLRTEDHGKFLRLLGRRDHLLERPLSFERNFIEEAEGGDGRTNRNARELPFVREIDLITADLFRSQFLGGLVEVARKQRNLLQIATLRERCKIPDPHVVDHALPKWCHEKLLCETELLPCRELLHVFVTGAFR
jgi:hypothetical protein